MTDLASERSEQHKGHGADWTKWLGHLAGVKNASGLELGCWKGESAEWFLEHVLTGDGASIITVDTFLGSAEHALGGIDCGGNRVEAHERLKRFGPLAEIVEARTEDALKRFASLSGLRFDFVYIDAAHDAANVLRDSVLAFDLLKVGGVVIWDDYEWKVFEQEVDRPKPAIDAFLTCFGRQLEVVGRGWQIAARKTA